MKSEITLEHNTPGLLGHFRTHTHRHGWGGFKDEGWGGVGWGGVDNSVCLDIHLHDDLFFLMASNLLAMTRVPKRSHSRVPKRSFFCVPKRLHYSTVSVFFIGIFASGTLSKASYALCQFGIENLANRAVSKFEPLYPLICLFGCFFTNVSTSTLVMDGSFSFACFSVSWIEPRTFSQS